MRGLLIGREGLGAGGKQSSSLRPSQLIGCTRHFEARAAFSLLQYSRYSVRAGLPSLTLSRGLELVSLALLPHSRGSRGRGSRGSVRGRSAWLGSTR